jgi:sarcosine oxidase subunit alpha
MPTAHASPPQHDLILTVNGNPIRIRNGATVAAALLQARAACRISVSGEPRAPLCAMGICMECRATVDGVDYMRTCQLLARNGMTVTTR